MLTGSKERVLLGLGKNHVRLQKGSVALTSKLVDGRFPDYQAVIPVGTDRKIEVDRSSFIVALQRAAILSNEKYKGVRLEANGKAMKIVAHNPLHEEAEEVLEASINFDQLAIGFNVTYLLDALSAIDAERVTLEMRDANSSCLITAAGGGADRHVVMPLKL